MQPNAIYQSMKNEQKHFFQNTQPYYAINEQDVVTHYVYYKSRRSLVRHVLCGLAIMSGLMICGLSLAAWWKTISFCECRSPHSYVKNICHKFI